MWRNIYTDNEKEVSISSTSAGVGALTMVTVLLVVEIANESANGPFWITHRVVLPSSLFPILVALCAARILEYAVWNSVASSGVSHFVVHIYPYSF